MWRWKGSPGSRCGTRDEEMGDVHKEKIKINNYIKIDLWWMDGGNISKRRWTMSILSSYLILHLYAKQGNL